MTLTFCEFKFLIPERTKNQYCTENLAISRAEIRFSSMHCTGKQQAETTRLGDNSPQLQTDLSNPLSICSAASILPY